MKRICSLVVTVLLITFCQAQKEKLELNLSKGETYFLNIRTFASLDVPMNGIQNKSQEQTNVKLKFKVSDIRDSIYNMVVTIDSIYYKGNLFNMVMNNLPDKDGKVPEDKENPIAKRLISSVKGIPIVVKMNKKGKITDVKYMLVDSTKNQVISNIFVQGILKMIPEIYPASEVAVGDKWNIPSPLPSTIFTTTGATFELKEVANNYLLISGNSTLNLKDNNVIAQKGKPAIKSDLTNTMLLNIKVDRKTGWITEGKVSQIVKGTVKADPKKEGDKEYPININTETIITDK